MFLDCTSLIKAPELPATSLMTHCYYGMFYGCTSLTKAPDLPATTLAQSCYSGMFEGCTSLQSIKVHFKKWYNSAHECTDWLSGVSATGIFYKPEELLVMRGDDYIPEGWEVVKY
jgi:hypothetical protein